MCLAATRRPASRSCSPGDGGGAPGWRAGLLQRPGVLPGGDPIPVLSMRAVGPVCLSDKVTPHKKKADPLRVPLGAVRSSPPGLVPGQARCGRNEEAPHPVAVGPAGPPSSPPALQAWAPYLRILGPLPAHGDEDVGVGAGRGGGRAPGDGHGPRLPVGPGGALQLVAPPDDGRLRERRSPAPARRSLWAGDRAGFSGSGGERPSVRRARSPGVPTCPGHVTPNCLSLNVAWNPQRRLEAKLSGKQLVFWCFSLREFFMVVTRPEDCTLSPIFTLWFKIYISDYDLSGYLNKCVWGWVLGRHLGSPLPAGLGAVPARLEPQGASRAGTGWCLHLEAGGRNRLGSLLPSLAPNVRPSGTGASGACG